MNAETRLVIAPNASLDRRGALIFLGLAASGVMGIALWCAWHGFWPVLPFAGLELLALAGALWVSLRRNRYREVLSFTPDLVRVEFGHLGHGPGSRLELPRAWTRVSLEPGVRRSEPGRLMLVYAGQQIIIGQLLTEEEREQLAARLKQLLAPGRPWEGDPDRSGPT